jgi:hypothetical protein
MKLTDSQLVILSGAAKRSDGTVLPFPKSMKLNKGSATLVLKSLLKHKLVAEQFAERESEAWREDGDGNRITLSITPAGMEAIGIEELPERTLEEAPTKSGAKSKTGRAGRTPKNTLTVRKGTKLAVLVHLLSRKSGVTIEEAAKSTGWQNHSVRGAISGALKKKFGLEVTSTASERGRIYRIGAGR